MTDNPPMKAVGWKIPESLRRLLNSHSEYLSAEKETTTDAMITEWLEQRLKDEDRKRALKTLGITEKDIRKSGV
jgi:hypothetical protein